MRILGIGGTNGSGKDTLGEQLAERYGWLFVSVTEILRIELRERKLPVERKQLRQLSAEWRRQYGLGVLIDKALEEFNRQKQRKNLGGLAISSLRNYGEADRVHELGGTVVWLDADPAVRYQRIYSRARGHEDKKTLDQFLAEEQDEMEHHEGDKHTLNLQGVKVRADIFLKNDGHDVDKFIIEAEKALKL